MSLTVSTIIPHKRILEEVFCLDERIHSVELRNQRPLILVIAGVGPYNGVCVFYFAPLVSIDLASNREWLARCR